MPNYVKNIIHALNEDVDFSEFTDEKGNFTFQKVIPMPENIYRGDLGEKERALYGANNWYDWSIRHWGTKWDACDSSVDGRTASFCTAWSCPEPVLVELGKKVGGIIVFFADEDIGSNYGAFFVTKKGEVKKIEDRYVLANVIHYGLDLYDASSVIWNFDWLLGDDEDE